MIELIKLDKQEDIMELYPMLKDIPVNDLSPETVLARTLSGDYGAIIGIEDTELKGFVIFRNNFPEFFIISLYAKHQVKKFLPLVIETLKDKDYTSIKAISSLPDKAYEKLTGMTKLWSVYKKEL